MYYDEYIMLSKDDMEKIKTKLNILKLLNEDLYAKEKVNEILTILDKEENIEKSMTIDEVITAKMMETKKTNPELNANLYILYRKLQDKRIDPIEAMRLYEVYTND